MCQYPLSLSLEAVSNSRTTPFISPKSIRAIASKETNGRNPIPLCQSRIHLRGQSDEGRGASDRCYHAPVPVFRVAEPNGFSWDADDDDAPSGKLITKGCNRKPISSHSLANSTPSPPTARRSRSLSLVGVWLWIRLSRTLQVIAYNASTSVELYSSSYIPARLCSIILRSALIFLIIPIAEGCYCRYCVNWDTLVAIKLILIRHSLSLMGGLLWSCAWTTMKDDSTRLGKSSLRTYFMMVFYCLFASMLLFSRLRN